MSDSSIFTKLSEPGQKTGSFVYRTVAADSTHLDILSQCGSAYDQSIHDLQIKASQSQEGDTITVDEAAHTRPVSDLVSRGFEWFHYKVTQGGGQDAGTHAPENTL